MFVEVESKNNCIWMGKLFGLNLNNLADILVNSINVSKEHVSNFLHSRVPFIIRFELNTLIY